MILERYKDTGELYVCWFIKNVIKKNSHSRKINIHK